MAEFKDGIAAAAALIEAYPPGILGAEPSVGFLKKLAERVRSIEEPAPGTALTVVAGLEVSFKQFVGIYVSIGGFRNPKSIEARGWDKARQVFMRLVKKQKHDVQAIMSGTAAYRDSRPAAQYVPAPEVFLNKEQFLKDWSRARETPQHASLYDVEAHLVGRITGR